MNNVLLQNEKESPDVTGIGPEIGAPVGPEVTSTKNSNEGPVGPVGPVPPELDIPVGPVTKLAAPVGPVGHIVQPHRLLCSHFPILILLY